MPNPLENYTEEEQRIMEERDAEAQRIKDARIAKEQYDKYRKEVAAQAAAKARVQNTMQGGKKRKTTGRKRKTRKNRR
jgi:hypothetical protein